MTNPSLHVCFSLLTCTLGFPLLPGFRKYGFAAIWGPRSRPSVSDQSRQSQPRKGSVATGQNTATHHQGEPGSPKAAPAKDGQQPSLLRGLARTAGNTAVESGISGMVGVGINRAFAPGSQPEPAQSGLPVNPGRAGAAVHHSSPPGHGAGKAASQASQGGEKGEPQPDPSGEKVGKQPNQDLEDVGSKPSQSGEGPSATEVSDAARRARVRKYVATTMSSSACKTAPLVTVVLTILALLLR